MKRVPNSKKQMIVFEEEISRIKVECDCNYIDAVVLYCEKNKLEMENIIPLINKSLKEKIAMDAASLNLIEKKNTLPI